ncbi:hypothetical protein SPRG_02624 [Saprolegnia parasitica CBS 223.65]|uniref:Uncharacterized protein n=1 Tax=Saprolegnia parasitica (strain CBS 223.65) TaxID=695850 RepID=A0A067D2E4_SAPPC|nr:hypothetical protein SPRG_02624 [Saprolegnia parasitica CBS 223.65]KDO32931.1 hypothetical protein SPRG_02624 [Saprolegnia parasitica CBS 223.65]|eukprot:XP_012196578.1 hypothetical protein SPRG_02624 [Saprolegnia parasitica CBS 223.65]
MPPHEQRSLSLTCVDRALLLPQRTPKRRREERRRLPLVYLLLLLLSGMTACMVVSIVQRMSLEATLLRVVQDLRHATLLHGENGLVHAAIQRPRVSSAMLDSECKVLGTLYLHLVDRQSHLLMEILRGAHVVVADDRGYYYDLLQNVSAQAYKRISSHYSSAPQYAVPQGPLLDTILVGTTARNDSWFQFEGAAWDPFARPIDSVLHVLHFLEYSLRGVQIGPLGTSAFTDKTPLRIA